MDRYFFEGKNFLGDRLRELRLTFGFKQADVAKALNVSRSTYSYYETGATRPDPFVLGKLANYYGIQVGYFFGEPLEEGLVLRDSGDFHQRITRLPGDEVTRVGDLFPIERALILFLRSNGYVDASQVLEELEVQVARLKDEEQKQGESGEK